MGSGLESRYYSIRNSKLKDTILSPPLQQKSINKKPINQEHSAKRKTNPVPSTPSSDSSLTKTTRKVPDKFMNRLGNNKYGAVKSKINTNVPKIQNTATKKIVQHNETNKTTKRTPESPSLAINRDKKAKDELNKLKKQNSKQRSSQYVDNNENPTDYLRISTALRKDSQYNDPEYSCLPNAIKTCDYYSDTKQIEEHELLNAIDIDRTSISSKIQANIDSSVNERDSNIVNVSKKSFNSISKDIAYGDSKKFNPNRLKSTMPEINALNEPLNLTNHQSNNKAIISQNYQLLEHLKNISHNEGNDYKIAYALVLDESKQDLDSFTTANDETKQIKPGYNGFFSLCQRTDQVHSDVDDTQSESQTDIETILDNDSNENLKNEDFKTKNSTLDDKSSYSTSSSEIDLAIVAEQKAVDLRKAKNYIPVKVRIIPPTSNEVSDSAESLDQTIDLPNPEFLNQKLTRNNELPNLYHDDNYLFRLLQVTKPHEPMKYILYTHKNTKSDLSKELVAYAEKSFWNQGTEKYEADLTKNIHQAIRMGKINIESLETPNLSDSEETEEIKKPEEKKEKESNAPNQKYKKSKPLYLNFKISEDAVDAIKDNKVIADINMLNHPDDDQDSSDASSSTYIHDTHTIDDTKECNYCKIKELYGHHQYITTPKISRTPKVSTNSISKNTYIDSQEVDNKMKLSSVYNPISNYSHQREHIDSDSLKVDNHMKLSSAYNTVPINFSVNENIDVESLKVDNHMKLSSAYNTVPINFRVNENIDFDSLKADNRMKLSSAYNTVPINFRVNENIDFDSLKVDNHMKLSSAYNSVPIYSNIDNSYSNITEATNQQELQNVQTTHNQNTTNGTPGGFRNNTYIQTNENTQMTTKYQVINEMDKFKNNNDVFIYHTSALDNQNQNESYQSTYNNLLYSALGSQGYDRNVSTQNTTESNQTSRYNFTYRDPTIPITGLFNRISQALTNTLYDHFGDVNGGEENTNSMASSDIEVCRIGPCCKGCQCREGSDESSSGFSNNDETNNIQMKDQNEKSSTTNVQKYDTQHFDIHDHDGTTDIVQFPGNASIVKVPDERIENQQIHNYPSSYNPNSKSNEIIPRFEKWTENENNEITEIIQKSPTIPFDNMLEKKHTIEENSLDLRYNQDIVVESISQNEEKITHTKDGTTHEKINITNTHYDGGNCSSNPNQTEKAMENISLHQNKLDYNTSHVNKDGHQTEKTIDHTSTQAIHDKVIHTPDGVTTINTCVNVTKSHVTTSITPGTNTQENDALPPSIE